MAYAQSSSEFEIQNLKEALAASQKQTDKYAHLIASLSYQLDDLRNNICHACRNKLASGHTSEPAITMFAPSGSTGTAPSTSSPLWRRFFQGHQRKRPSRPKLLSVSRELGVAQHLSASKTTRTPTHPGPDEEIIIPPQLNSEPKWSVAYRPEVRQALDLRLAHTFVYKSPVSCVKMSPDGQRLAMGLAFDGKTYINEVKTGKNICVVVDRYVKDTIIICSAQFSPDGQLLATAASDLKIRIWDIAHRRMRALFKGHKDVVNSVAFSPNGRFLVSGADDRSVRTWNLQDGSSYVLPVIGRISCFISVAFSPNGRYIAGGNLDNSLWIWDSRTSRLVAKWCGRSDDVWCIEFTPDGKGLMSGGSDKMVRHWDVSSLGTCQGSSASLVVNEERGFPEVRRFLGHNACVLSVAFFPNGQWTVTGSTDESVRIWDTQSGVCQLTLHGHTDRVRGVDVSRTQNFLVTAGDDGRVAVWRYEMLQNVPS